MSNHTNICQLISLPTFVGLKERKKSRKQLQFPEISFMIYKVNIKEAMELSEPKLVSPLLDGFILGEAISDHHGVSCCPAIHESTNERYIVKIISIPATQVQLDALLLTGACADREQALAYFRELTEGVTGEADILQRLSKLEGFVAYSGYQVEPMDEGAGFRVYLVSPYKRSLEKLIINEPLTHLSAVNLGLDLCAALTACRRAGFLYADLKPENIFLTPTQGFRIGDLGFLPLTSLKYASLPEKYRSCYTAPEIQDEMSELNAAIDIYALGLILYRIYNNGQLPFDGSAPAQQLPAPMYADYEMAEIILKACAPNPADRWEDPAHMGQALVDYMQRNSINDTPIIPVAVIEDAPVIEDTEFLTEEENDEAFAEILASIPDEINPTQLSMENGEEPLTVEANDEVADEADANVSSNEDEISGDDQLSFLDENGLTVEVAQMLAQADDLLSHELPEPVVAPAPVEITIPPIPVQTAQENEDEEDAVPPVTAETPEVPEETSNESNVAEEASEEEENFPVEPSQRPKRRWIGAVVAALVLLLIGTGIWYWYGNIYLQQVEDFRVSYQDGQLQVFVDTEVSEDLLTVVCTDTYGNTMRAPITNGQAVFTELKPATQYRLRLEIAGLHKLKGPITGSYTTSKETQILDLSAVCGPEDGSVILSFSINGTELDTWQLIYTASGETEKQLEFTGHSVTVYDLTPGKTYSFRLVPPRGLHVLR
jgi:serine/threonine protein kinase